MNARRYARCFTAGFLLIAAVALFRWVLLWNVPYTYMDGEYPYWTQQKDYVRSRGDVPEVLFLGDSRMKAGIIPEELCANAYNLALGGGTTIEMYYSLRRYLRNHPKPEMVIIGFAPDHCTNEGWFATRSPYCHFLPLTELLEAQYVGSQVCGWDFQTYRHTVIDTLKYALLFPQKYSAACINSRFHREAFNRKEYEKNVRNKGQMFWGMRESDEGLNQEANSAEFAPNPRFTAYFQKIIRLCAEHDIPLFVEQAPMNTPSWNAINRSGYYRAFQAYLAHLAEAGVPVEYTVPCYDPSFFGDPSHVNPRGAARFTAEIKAKYGL